MLDKLLKLVDGPLQEMLAGLDKDKASESAHAVEGSIYETLKKQVASGDLSAVKEMFSGKDTDASNPVVKNLEGEVSHSLMDKLGIDSNTAMTMAVAAIPMLMNIFNKKVNDAPQANEDIMSSIADSLKGGRGSENILGSLLGGGDGKGGMDLGGLINMGKGLFK